MTKRNNLLTCMSRVSKIPYIAFIPLAIFYSLPNAVWEHYKHYITKQRFVTRYYKGISHTPNILSFPNAAWECRKNYITTRRFVTRIKGQAAVIFHIILSLFITLVFLSGCGNDNSDTGLKDKSNKQKSINIVLSDSVVEVIDGDTFVLADGRYVRIAMIDTPEHGEPLFGEATACLDSLIINKHVRLQPVGSGQDRYGRTLAEVKVDTINTGMMILSRGLASLYLYSDNAKLKDDYLPAQVLAMDKKLGIWSLPEPLKEEFYISIKGSYRFHRPLCPHLKEANVDKIVRISSRIEALRQGLSSCRTCKP